jgi:hypothetical protein
MTKAPERGFRPAETDLGEGVKSRRRDCTTVPDWAASLAWALLTVVGAAAFVILWTWEGLNL